MRRQVQALSDAVTNISPVLKDTPRSSSSDPHRMDGFIATKVDLENEIEAQTVLLAEITRTINALPDSLHISIITSRYISRMEWREIAMDLHVSEGRIYQLHRDALASLEKLIAGYR
jgi:DNA-directed RNA polymerase specialized sigma subunit